MLSCIPAINKLSKIHGRKGFTHSAGYRYLCVWSKNERVVGELIDRVLERNILLKGMPRSKVKARPAAKVWDRVAPQLTPWSPPLAWVLGVQRPQSSCRYRSQSTAHKTLEINVKQTSIENQFRKKYHPHLFKSINIWTMVTCCLEDVNEYFFILHLFQSGTVVFIQRKAMGG